MQEISHKCIWYRSAVTAFSIAASLFADGALGQLPDPATQQFLREMHHGRRLYEARCQGCHTQAMHWRDRRLATDMQSLQFQVQRWQNYVEAGWDEREVELVTRYLNTTYYNFRSRPARE